MYLYGSRSHLKPSHLHIYTIIRGSPISFIRDFPGSVTCLLGCLAAGDAVVTIIISILSEEEDQYACNYPIK